MRRERRTRATLKKHADEEAGAALKRRRQRAAPDKARADKAASTEDTHPSTPQVQTVDMSGVETRLDALIKMMAELIAVTSGTPERPPKIEKETKKKTKSKSKKAKAKALTEEEVEDLWRDIHNGIQQYALDRGIDFDEMSDDEWEIYVYEVCGEVLEQPPLTDTEGEEELDYTSFTDEELRKLHKELHV